MYVTGRAKDLIIIRGQNYYPQDVEATVERSGADVRHGSGAAFSIERDGEERLVIVFEAERGMKPDTATAQLDLIRAAIVRDHEIAADDIVLVRAGEVPKTSSGKIQRRACRAAYLDGTLARWPAGSHT